MYISKCVCICICPSVCKYVLLMFALFVWLTWFMHINCNWISLCWFLVFCSECLYVCMYVCSFFLRWIRISIMQRILLRGVHTTTHVYLPTQEYTPSSFYSTLWNGSSDHSWFGKVSFKVQPTHEYLIILAGTTSYCVFFIQYPYILHSRNVMKWFCILTMCS